MIPFLPTPLPDELLYSVVARYSKIMGYPTQRKVNQELFGSGNVISTIEFPSHLSYFVAALPPGKVITEELLIQEHTMFPYFSSWMPEDQAELLKRDMKGSNGPGAHMRAGLMASKVRHPEKLKYCKVCAVQDRKKYGSAYWHRVHQLPGVVVCSLHNVLLSESCVEIRNRKSRLIFVSAEQSIPRTKDVITDPPDSNPLLCRIAIDSEWLLSHSLSKGLDEVHKDYLYLLYEKGYCNPSGRIVSCNDLVSSFTNFWSVETLSRFGCEIDSSNKDNWLLKLLRKPGSTLHPLFHLLLINYLGYSIEQFSSFKKTAPFGDSSWPCLNPVCPGYKQEVINEVKTVRSSYTHGRPIGIFACKCGFIYKRTGPDNSPEDHIRYDRVEAYGELWAENLQALWRDNKVSLRQIAKTMGVDPLTVKRQAKKMGLDFPRFSSRPCNLREEHELKEKPSKSVKSFEFKRECNRANWVKLLHENSILGIKAVRKLAPALYSWLYRNDRTWLKQNSLLRKIPKTKMDRVNWQQRDLELSVKVLDVAALVNSSATKPEMISVSSIGRSLGQLSLLQKHIDKLPLTRENLIRVVDTPESFAIRRLKWAYKSLITESTLPKKWKVIRLAGIDRWKDNDAILAELKKLQFDGE